MRARRDSNPLVDSHKIKHAARAEPEIYSRFEIIITNVRLWYDSPT